jgi:tRNA nucleotidyltransferase/poly(A) polymerase
MIHQGEQLDSLGLEDLVQFFKRLIHRMITRYADDSVVCVRCHRFS